MGTLIVGTLGEVLGARREGGKGEGTRRERGGVEEKVGGRGASERE